ncbi:MAG TPA: hypothetical protein VNN79_19085, partial [Actinomycetota bacterium]|nr:hypothetical protein [Actinomycetota bacterium]
MAAGSAVAILAAVQEAARLLQVQRLGDTCAISGDRGCRPLVIPDTVDALHRLDRRAGVLLISGLSLLAAGGVAWLVWQHRAHRLLRDPLATPGLRWSPGWAVGWW